MMTQDTFDIQTTIIDELKNSSSFLLALQVKNKDDVELLSKKINLQMLNMELFDTKNMPLVSIYIPETDITNNYLVNHAILRIESYTTNRIQAKALIKATKEIARNKLDLRIVYEGEQPCDIKNVYKYRLEYLPTSWS